MGEINIIHPHRMIMSDSKAPSFNYHVNETYVNKTTNTRYGESGLYESFTDSLKKLFQSFQKEYGGCASKMFIDSKSGTKHIGWVFAKKMKYEDTGESYVREVWVEIKELYHAK